jgi:hypothetical protein
VDYQGLLVAKSDSFWAAANVCYTRGFLYLNFTNNKMMITLGFSWLQLFFSFSVVSFIFVKKKQQQKTNLCVQFQFPSMTSLIFFQLCRFYFDIVSEVIIILLFVNISDVKLLNNIFIKSWSIKQQPIILYV